MSGASRSGHLTAGSVAVQTTKSAFRAALGISGPILGSSSAVNAPVGIYATTRESGGTTARLNRGPSIADPAGQASVSLAHQVSYYAYHPNQGYILQPPTGRLNIRYLLLWQQAARMYTLPRRFDSALDRRDCLSGLQQLRVRQPRKDQVSAQVHGPHSQARRLPLPCRTHLVSRQRPRIRIYTVGWRSSRSPWPETRRRRRRAVKTQDPGL